MRAPNRTAALALLLSGTAFPAAADITPEEVWADWQRMLATYEIDVEVGSEAASSDALLLNDVALSYAFPEDEGTLDTVIPEIALEARGDGTVEITLAPEFAIDITGTDPETDSDFAFTVIARQPGLVTIASRDGTTTRYNYVGADASGTVESLTVDGEEVDFDIAATLRGMSGSYEITEGTPRGFVSRTRADAMGITVDGTDPEEPGTAFDLELTLNDIVGRGEGTISALSGFESMSAMLTEGFATDWSLDHGAAEYTISATGPGEVFNMTTTAEAGTFNGSVSPDGLVYGGGNTGLSVALSGSEIPFPELTFSMAETEGQVAIPAVPSEEATDFGLLLRFVGLEVDEGIWSMFDPAGQLPRDPATVILDIAGKGRWLVDIFDPEVQPEDAPGEIPGEIESLTIGNLEVSAGGARLSGEGAFEFDNSGTGPFAPAPSPFGAASLELTGGNTLLDTLVAMGLIPQEQAMGARMMLGLFARPGDGPDTLVSTIEVGRDGSISANGQRIR